MSRERSPADHDTLSCRLSQILLRLNQGECLRPTQLAQEFGVSLRTIQRDLGHRLANPRETRCPRTGPWPRPLGCPPVRPSDGAC